MSLGGDALSVIFEGLAGEEDSILGFLGQSGGVMTGFLCGTSEEVETDQSFGVVSSSRYLLMDMEDGRGDVLFSPKHELRTDPRGVDSIVGLSVGGLEEDGTAFFSLSSA